MSFILIPAAIDTISLSFVKKGLSSVKTCLTAVVYSNVT